MPGCMLCGWSANTIQEVRHCGLLWEILKLLSPKHLIKPRGVCAKVGRPRVPHAPRARGLRLVHLLHLLCTPPEAEAERLDWQLCAGLLLHRPPLVGGTGDRPAAVPPILAAKSLNPKPTPLNPKTSSAAQQLPSLHEAPERPRQSTLPSLSNYEAECANPLMLKGCRYMVYPKYWTLNFLNGLP